MNTYRLTGTSRQPGAIGISEPFTHVITSPNARAAYEQHRMTLYATREQVHITQIERASKIDGAYHVVPTSYWLFSMAEESI